MTTFPDIEVRNARKEATRKRYIADIDALIAAAVVERNETERRGITEECETHYNFLMALYAVTDADEVYTRAQEVYDPDGYLYAAERRDDRLADKARDARS